MENSKENHAEELQYLENTIDFLNKEIDKGMKELSEHKERIVEARRDMWQNTAHFSNDFEKMTEVNQHLVDVNSQASGYLNSLGLVDKYRKMLSSPYFGRFDFKEDGLDESEKIYIGLHNAMDQESYQIFVYDWRTPIASIFYQNEIGRANYYSPMGEIYGEVSLKRQYKIENSKLIYFFDSSLRIGDEILQEILCRNASAKMRNIVESIQKEQDKIIRDIENELLIVQGVAGSGKTSIALHRIAFLLYQGRSSHLGSNNIIIISPNNIFSKYISRVLPELGEENVNQITFDEMIELSFKNRFNLQKREQQLEELITSDKIEREFRTKSIEFKGSGDFVKILDRFLSYYVRKLIPVEDVYFDGKIIETRNQIKNVILNNKINLPLTKHLNIIENKLIEKIHPLRRNKINKIEKIVQRSENGHELEIKSFARLISIKEAKAFMEKLRKFTSVDYFELYKLLFKDATLFRRISRDIELPDNIEEIILKTKDNLNREKISHEDFSPLLYLKLMLEGSDEFGGIKQVVVDEAQDYYPIQYEIFKLLFKNAKYTVLGDVNQSIEKNADRSLYDSVEEILEKRKSTKLFLSKGYRSSYEISQFNRKILNRDIEYTPFDRHDKAPEIIKITSYEEMDKRAAQDIVNLFNEGYESIAVICKTQMEAEKVYARLDKLVNIKLLNSTSGESENGAVVISSYLSKGLEFDAVIVYDVSNRNYFDELDRKLLYIACTRALHRLFIYSRGEQSKLIK